MRVTLLVTSSIAAYKSAELVRELRKRGHTVRVALSDGAREFVTPLTLQTLSGNPVATALFSLDEELRIGHISLADDTDVVLVAPATANFLAKAASGVADDLPSTVFLATRARTVVAPAMNVNMWENPVTKQNVQRLKERGVEFVGPGVGELACGWEGSGRLEEPRAIVDFLEEGRRRGATKCVVVTAGPTRERLDPIRYITNSSSGKMGVAIAKEGLRRGFKVVLLRGPGVETQLRDPLLSEKSFESALNLRTLLRESLKAEELPTTLFMAAAPGDYRAEEIAETKLRSDKAAPLSLSLVPNPDIVGEIGLQRGEFPRLETVVAFCAESESGERLRERAREKLERKNADFIVANSISESFGLDTTNLLVMRRDGTVEETKGIVEKRVAASWLFDQVFENVCS